MTATNRIIRPFIALLTVGLLVVLLVPLATRSSQAAQPAAAAPAVTGFKGAVEGQALAGKVAIEATVTGSRIAKVVFQLDGSKSKSYTDRNAPYFFLGDENGAPKGWDTARYPDGVYMLTATVTDRSGRRGSAMLHFSVSNSAQPQPTATQPQPTATQPQPTATQPQPQPTATATPGGNTPPVAGQQCPAWVHDRYVTAGPDGRMYATWHPPSDPEYRCWFGHEHGSDPRAYVGFAQSGMPAFGYSAMSMGMEEPHNGFKVYVTNNDLNGRAWMITLHQGTGGPKRATVQHHTLDWHISTTAGQPLADIHHMGDFGYASPNCRDSEAIPGTATGYPFSRHQAQRRFIPTTDCAGQTPYELWSAAVNIAGIFSAGPAFDIDNPTTVVNLADLTQTRYMCEFRSPREDCTTSATQWGGTKRGVVHPGQYANNTTGNATIYTDARGKPVSAGAPNAIKQTIATNGWDTRNCCGNQVVFRYQGAPNGVYIADPQLFSHDFGDGTTRWPN